MLKDKRIIIIGLDGVPFRLLDDLAKRNVIPNIKKIIAQGIFKKMQSSIPEVSAVAWSSLITGKNPGEHGIFGFTDLEPNSFKLRFPNFNDLKSPPFWETLDKKSTIINVPATYPVHRMNGIHISGFVSPDLEKSVYPKGLIPKLREFDYRVDVDSQKAHQSLELFLDDLDETLNARIKTLRYLWKNFAGEIFMLVFTETDRLMHFFWDAYEDDTHQYHQDFLKIFKRIDEVIGKINTTLKDRDLLILLSDHGFERLENNVYINYLLKKAGFLKFKISQETLAFALDPARIYLHLKDKYPYGRIKPKDKKTLLKELISLFGSLKINHKKVIKNIYQKEEIYAGPFLKSAPDLVLVGNNGFNLKANINGNQLTDRGIFQGKHTQDNAFLLLKGFTHKKIIPDSPDVFCLVDLLKAG